MMFGAFDGTEVGNVLDTNVRSTLGIIDSFTVGMTVDIADG